MYTTSFGIHLMSIEDTGFYYSPDLKQFRSILRAETSA